MLIQPPQLSPYQGRLSSECCGFDVATRIQPGLDVHLPHLPPAFRKLHVKVKLTCQNTIPANHFSATCRNPRPLSLPDRPGRQQSKSVPLLPLTPLADSSSTISSTPVPVLDQLSTRICLLTPYLKSSAPIALSRSPTLGRFCSKNPIKFRNHVRP